MVIVVCGKATCNQSLASDVHVALVLAEDFTRQLLIDSQLIRKHVSGTLAHLVRVVGAALTVSVTIVQ